MRSRPAMVAGVVGAAALTVVVLVLVLTGDPRPSVNSEVAAVAGRLRCPTCAAESVADSQTPMARSMRREIRRQIESGRSPDQVVAWFRARYGDQDVLVPQADGAGWLLWLAPGAAAVGGLVAVVMVLRRRDGAPQEGEPRTGSLPKARLAAVGVLLAVVGAGVPMVVAHAGERGVPAASPGPESGSASTGTDSTSGSALLRWVTLARQLDGRDSYSSAVPLWRRALRSRPSSALLRSRLAFDLLRTGRPADAEQVVRPAVRSAGATKSLSMLVLGLAQRQQGKPVGVVTLRRFLHDYPEHPAAAQVRQLLGAQG